VEPRILVPSPHGTCLHQLFEAQARRTPDDVAVVAEGGAVRYGALDRRANRLARHLRTMGARVDMPVGVCLERSVDLVVALLAVLKIGAVHLPLDPRHPPARRAFVLRDAGAELLVTHRRHLANADPSWSGRVLCLEEAGPALERLAGGELGLQLSPEQRAYITYTSGSTGDPKGVETLHRGAVNYLRQLAAQGYVDAADVVLQLAPPSFDASVRDLLGPLVTGARLVLMPDARSREPAALRGTIEREGVTCLLSAVPSLLRLLFDETTGWGGAHRSLRQILVSGDVLDAATVARVRACLGPAARIVNLYGPTECTMTTTAHVVGPTPQDSIPIGRPLGGTRVYVLDEWLDPVPADVVGELYIGGEGVTRGYVGRPALTAERYLPDPFATVPNGRMYRTGDRGRLRQDGTLEFHGRTDHQVQVHGVRVEPGEVEAALRRHPDVADAAVVPHEGPGDARRLVAYLVVSRHGRRRSAADLRRFLAAWLPDYMVPATYVHLDALPMTPNGKVDRRALPPPAADRPGASEQGPAPRTLSEVTLARLWCEVLEFQQVGVDASFFELGGDSLLAARLAARIRRAFGRDVSLRALFDAPTVAAMVEVIAGSAAAQDATAAGRPHPEHPGVRAVSFAQRRLWFLDRLVGDNPVFTIACAFRVRGALDLEALRRALETLVVRHEPLRTTFPEANGEPVAVVHDRPLVTVEVMATKPADTELAVRELTRRPFDLSAGPLLRLAVLSEAEDQQVLVLTVHHIVIDGWSLAVLFDELRTTYRAAVAGQAPALPPLPMRYTDHAALEQARLDGDVLERECSFWRAHLAGAPAVLALPTDRPRPMVLDHRGAVLRRTLPAALTAGLAELAQQERASLFMGLLSGWAAILHRHSGQRDLVIGVPLAGRYGVEVEPLIGLFLNLVPLRIALQPALTFRALLGQVRDRALGAFAHGTLPFERLVEALQPRRSLAHTPVFQVLFDLQRPSRLHLDGLVVTPLDVDVGAAQFDLSLSIEQGPDGLRAVYTYNTELFDGATIERLAGHLEVLLAAAVADPDRPLSRLPVLTAAERHRQLVAWNATDTARPDLTVHELVERQVRRRPDAVAVRAEDACLTFAELDTGAGQLARHLRRLGVGPERPVGIFLERSADLLVGLLAVLKAGGAYVPLDPAHPPRRLAHVLDDAMAPVVITRRALLPRLPATPARVVLLDADAGQITPVPVPAPPTPTAPARLHPDNLVYVMYTSGSTGVPKGVEVTHRSVVNLLLAMAASLGLDEHDLLLSVTTPTFDIATLELFLPLIVGAPVVIAHDSSTADPEELHALLVRSQATVLQATPATWQALVEQCGDRLSVDTVLCGGDLLNARLATALRRAGRHAWNLYGPTETTIWSTVARLDRDPPPVPIGRPIANTRVYVLDGQLEPVPVGVPGELYIAGAGVARGYRGRPGLTAERFLPDPFSSRPGGRLYRTGDLARWLPDGTLEHLGRGDRQLKIRGFRVEAGEVEAALAAHPAVQGAAVLAQDDATGQRQLVAYLAVREPLADGALRSFVAERLPEYMVPSLFVQLDALPLTPNGKLNRAALLPPAGLPAGRRHSTPPSTPVEQALARIWSDVLGREPIGRDDDFFDVGGHSLLAIRVAARVRHDFGVEFPVRELFARRTIRRLALLLAAAPAVTMASGSEPEQP